MNLKLLKDSENYVESINYTVKYNDVLYIYTIALFRQMFSAMLNILTLLTTVG
jgi:hypothetical protein